MTQQSHSEIVSFEKFNKLLKIVLEKIQEDKTFHPDTILALSTGGFPVAAALAKKIGVKSRSVIGIPIYKDEKGNYFLDETLIKLDDFSNRQVLVIDDSSKRGLLLRQLIDVIEKHKGKAKSCVLIAWKDRIQPDYVAEICDSEPPDFFWEE